MLPKGYPFCTCVVSTHVGVHTEASDQSWVRFLLAPSTLFFSYKGSSLAQIFFQLGYCDWPGSLRNPPATVWLAMGVTGMHQPANIFIRSSRLQPTLFWLRHFSSPCFLYIQKWLVVYSYQSSYIYLKQLSHKFISD